MVDDSQTPPIDIDKIKQESVKAAQEALISKLTGDEKKYSWEKAGREAPANYDELFSEVEKRMPNLSQEEIDKRVEAKLQEQEEARKKAEEAKQQDQVKSIEERQKKFDTEWMELVSAGKMPKVSDTNWERINKGERLTKEEILADEGLKARLELVELAKDKGAKLAYYEDYENRSSGKADAPVLGGKPTAPSKDTGEYSYEDVAKARKKLFGF